MHLVLVFLAIFIILPILAPVFMNNGSDAPARVIYWAYSHFCHQFAYRSWFLFAEQPYYPIEKAGLAGALTYEEAFHADRTDENLARSIIGTRSLGYKMAFCQRDLAMYAALLLFGMVFSATGRKIKRIPFLIWLIIGVVPLGLDGVIQLIGNVSAFDQIQWESTPFLRTLTGGLFGFMSGWFLFPSMESVIKRNLPLPKD